MRFRPALAHSMVGALLLTGLLGSTGAAAADEPIAPDSADAATGLVLDPLQPVLDPRGSLLTPLRPGGVFRGLARAQGEPGGGTLEGRVSYPDGDVLRPLPAGEVRLTYVEGSYRRVLTSPVVDGAYRVTGLLPRDYTVCVVDAAGDFFFQCVGGQPQPALTGALDGEPVRVGEGADVQAPDLLLTAKARVSGQVSFEGIEPDAAPAFRVSVVDRAGAVQAVGASVGAGTEFLLDSVLPGEWTLLFTVADPSRDKAFEPVYLGGARTLEDARFLTVAAGARLSGATLEWARAAAPTSVVSGSVQGRTNFGGTAPGSVTVDLVDGKGAVVQSATAVPESEFASRSVYSFAKVVPGRYTLRFVPIEDASSTVAWRSAWLGGAAGIEDAEFFTVAGDGAPRSDWTTLDPVGGVLTGRLVGLDGDDEQVLPDGFSIEATAVDGSWSTLVPVGEQGDFAVIGVPAGEYSVCAVNYAGPPVEFFDRCLGGAAHPAEAGPAYQAVTVTADARVALPDLVLTPVATVSGALSGDALTGSPAYSVFVQAVDPEGDLVGSSELSIAAGEPFRVSELPPGEYTLRFLIANEDDPEDYRYEWWGGSSDFEHAVFFPVAQGARLTGFDYEVRRTPPLPLLESRTPPVVQGVAAVGATLTATAGEWSSPVPADNLQYQWLRGGEPIPGAVEASYRATTADGGARLSVRVRAGLSGHRPGEAVSAETAPVAVTASRVGITTSLGGVQEYGAEDRVRITIPVRHLDGSPAAGEVVLLSGSQEVARLGIVNGQAAYRLPRTQAVGAIELHAVYEPSSPAVTPATSPSATVTVTKAEVVLQAFGTPPSAGSPGSVLVRATTTVAWPQGTIQIKRGSAVIAQAKVQGEMRGVVRIQLPAGTPSLDGLSAHYLGSSVVKRGSTDVLAPVATAR